ncbi:hypothetical protein OSB04_002394 [Centaurea solstitialis]|uniref:non-specific serine/threonine protein kinase n=1 Tax=Centaurea solstitialis TaxID=347529 RepID=A0AA38TSU2_9ASTR|nr:hypothetical protein OSB04_002394 [Centaurea solstitialis]
MKLPIWVLFLFSILIISDHHLTTAQNDFWGTYCGDSGNYTDNSDYKRNLDDLLYSFTETNNGFGFYNSTSGDANAAALCRGDVDQETCRRCVDDATRRLRQVCPNQIEAAGWYDGCFLKYSNRSTDDIGIGFSVYGFNRNNVSDSGFEQWNQTVASLLGRLRREAGGGGDDRRKYASGNLTVAGSSTVYGTVQCTPDLTAAACDDCLAEATAEIRRFERSLGVRVYKTSCVLRYEDHVFFNSTWFPTAPPPSGNIACFRRFPTFFAAEETKTSKSSNIGIIVGAIAAAVVVIVAIIFLIFRRRQKRRQKGIAASNPRTSTTNTHSRMDVSPAVSGIQGQPLMRRCPGPIYAGPRAQPQFLIGLGYVTAQSMTGPTQGPGPLLPEFLVGFDESSPEGSKHERGDDDTGEMNSFSLSTIQVATNNFSIENKLGEGGFGPVYKGKLQDGKVIAVKRLSRNSGQGLVEFKTEVQLIIKLQHKNLVRLLGYCVKGSERLLIYEFMANNSLDTFLFDANKCKELDWAKRANIVSGIAKGLRYLHEDSRLKIIHRDMKASNILLDDEMNSKISDFGTARIFGGNQMEANTNRIVGTYGYMAPEYAMEGIFSTKSDVYSFGVLLLEIISGQRNNRFSYQNQPQNFLATAYRLWKEKKGEELIDGRLIENSSVAEALRWINIALLCVQEDPQDRPTMSTVVFMLEGQWSANLPTPSEPPLSFARFAAVSEHTTTSGDATASTSTDPTSSATLLAR